MSCLLASAFGCGDDDPSVSADGAPSLADSAAVSPDASTSREWLSGMGLYSDIASKTIAPGAIEFVPSHILWSDGSVKQRWLFVPEGETIDTSDMDRWVVPIGTRVWKQFTRDGRRVETRLIERTGPGPFDYDMVAYIWLEDESDAVRAPQGGTNVLGTDHDVPDEEQCAFCHNGEAGRILGLSAVQLSRANNEPTVTSLAEAGLLSDPPEPSAELGPPGTQDDREALGYLHANCGHCHNSQGGAWPDTQMQLRLQTADRTVEATTIYQSTVGVALDHYQAEGFTLRIDPGSPQTSALVHRMSARGDDDQMPPVATELVHDDGVNLISNWIIGLPTE